MPHQNTQDLVFDYRFFSFDNLSGETRPDTHDTKLSKRLKLVSASSNLISVRKLSVG